MSSQTLLLCLWIALGLLIAGSIYLIIEGVLVYNLFRESIVGRLIKTLVIVFLIELYSLGIVSLAFITFKPEGVIVILPIVLLWIVTLVFAIFSIRSAKMEVNRLMK
jgi:hypothetical protein